MVATLVVPPPAVQGRLAADPPRRGDGDLPFDEAHAVLRRVLRRLPPRSGRSGLDTGSC